MRTSIFATIVVAGSAIAFSATAQAQQAAPSEQPKAQMKSDVDKDLKSSGPGTNEQMQRDADKGLKTSEPNQGQVSSGQAQDQQPIGSTSSTHNPRPSTSTTGLNRKDGETGTDSSTHNPPPERR